MQKDLVLAMEHLFFQGKYSVILKKSEGVSPFIIGAYIFSGESIRALAYFDKNKSKLTLSQLQVAQFFIGLHHTRSGDYPSAKRLFISNLWLMRKTKKSKRKDSFYIYQGLAFIRYFYGLYDKANFFAEKSINSCQNEDKEIALIFSFELLAHSLNQQGQYYRGEYYFNQSSKIAKKYNCPDETKQNQSSLLSYQLEALINPEKSIKKTHEYIKKSKLEDPTRLAQSFLSLAKAYLILGKKNLSKECYEKAAAYIFKNDNRRQGITLNMGLSYIYFLEQNISSSLLFLRNAYKQADVEVDLHYRFKLKSLEFRICKMHPEFSIDSIWDISNECIALWKKIKVSSISNQRDFEIDIELREFKKNHFSQFLKKANFNKFPSEDDLKKIIKSKKLGLLNLFDEVIKRNSCIWFISTTKDILVYNKGEVFLLSEKLTANLYNFMLLLSQKKTTHKSELISRFWGFEYDSFIHDNLIHQTIYRLRKIDSRINLILNIDQNFLSWSESFTFFNNKVRIKDKSIKVNLNSISKTSKNQKLNFRQLQILEKLEVGDSITPNDLCIEFGVSRMTATRDLSKLVKLKLFEAFGKTRSIKYVKS